MSLLAGARGCSVLRKCRRLFARHALFDGQIAAIQLSSDFCSLHRGYHVQRNRKRDMALLPGSIDSEVPGRLSQALLVPVPVGQGHDPFFGVGIHEQHHVTQRTQARVGRDPLQFRQILARKHF